MSMEINSKFINSEVVACFKEVVKLSGSQNEDHIITDPM
ncbi:hypothetical protein A2U01_0110371, partial [Trifolium medium]|nr:hypothetical protein [Trifolium medium]